MSTLGIVFVVALVGAIAVTRGDRSEWRSASASRPERIELNLSAYFTGSQLILANKDAFAWTSCELEVNRGFRLALRQPIDAHGFMTIGAAQFTKRDGTRFNPFTTKPVALSARCEEGDAYVRW